MNKTGEKIDEILAAQKDRLILWAPVVLATGVGFYFFLRFEPPVFITAISIVLAVAALFFGNSLRHAGGVKSAAWIFLAAFFLMTLGFGVSQLRTVLLDTILLEKEIKGTTVTGTVKGMDMLEPGQGYRIILKDLEIEKLPPEKTPELLRLRLRQVGGLDAGDRITLRVGLNAPAAPVAPHAFDFQRYSYFNKIGAFGFSYTDPVIISQGKADRFETLRNRIADRIRQYMKPAEGAVAVALVTGEMTGVSEEDWDAMRVSGLAHMLSISGLHISLVAGVIFFFTRFIMAAIPGFALHFPIKKFSAVLAFAGILFYTLLAGAPIPTIRSMIMTGLVLFAVMIDRAPFSTRMVAVAAFFVLLLWPEALWGASFQMSFAAITALIVSYEYLGPRLVEWHRNAGWFKRIGLYFFGVCLSTIVASLATAPFSLFHFQQLGLYSLPANAAAAPVMSFIVMPAAILACLAMPFGLEQWPLWVMEKGVAMIIDIARDVEALPESSLKIHSLPLSFLLFVVFGALILMFWKGWRGKMAALAPFAAAFIIAASYQPPDILVASSMKLMAVRDGNGNLHISSRTADRFTAENWMRRNGQDEEQAPRWPVEGHDEMSGLTCGEEGCRYVRGDRVAAFSFSPASLPEDCASADIVIATNPVERRSACAAPVVIDRFDISRNGAYAVWLNGRHESVGQTRGQRPWTVSNRR